MKVYKRGNRWWSYERKDGKAVRKSLGADVRTRAQALAVAKGKDLPPEPPKLTLRAFFKDYLIDARIRISAATSERCKRSFKAFMRDMGDFTAVESLTTRHFNKWAATLLDRGRSPGGINLDLRYISAALKRGEELGLISFAPKIEMVKTPKRLPRHLSEDEVQQILDAETNADYRRFWTFLVWTGLRRQEAFNLDWRSVTLGDKPSMQVIGKGDRERIVPLLRPALEAMGNPKSTGKVFELCGLDNLTSRFKHTARLAGLGNARLHDLRHTCFTLMVGHGVPLKLVQDIAGHSSINTTMNYAKIFTGDAHSILEKAFEM